ncbi:hypothetical protein [Pseudomonas putida]|uniref:Uncharacterized protein n=1 Tax=Pseudomonas putida TaxID=303 RepID=A0A8I1EFN5_PSEPU|nr:hypothetical protein [Pseudomonas putida]MBI6885794.1 hypothetical protein [Pseudomonas putida]
MKTAVTVLLSLIVVALLAFAGYHLNKAQEIGPPITSDLTGSGETTDTKAATPAVEVQPSTADEAKNIEQKIDASTDKAMVDSLDYISKQLDDHAQQQLQDDYSVIASVLTSQGIEDSKSGDDSLAKVREAINGKTAAELTEIADKLRPKD